MKTERHKIPKGGFNSIRVRRHGEESYLEGTITTPYGIVDCYAQGGLYVFEYSYLWFVYGGFRHTRRFNKRYTARGLHTKAMQFAREVTTEGGVK